jgi:TonB family protein
VSPAEPPPGPSLPVLTFQAPATYPEAALAAGKEAAVLLELDVDATGAVLAARVVEPVGEGFDEAAVAAARGFRFTPARDATGAPAPARIQYRYRFTVARAAAPSIDGYVRDATSDLPFPGLEVRVVGADGTAVYALTDAEGRFVVSGLPPGAWTVAASPPGHLSTTTPVEVKEGAVAQVVLRAEAEGGPSAVGDELTIKAERDTTEVTERTLSQEEVRYLPGTGGDVVKVVQNLPGVARAPLGVGQLIIRGTAPEDSRYFLDGAAIPIVFHFSGLSTILNGDFVSEVAYLPGNYSVRYGRALGGLVDLRTKDAIPERSRGFVALDLYQGTAYVQQRVGDKTALEFSLRRSWIDAVLTPVLSNTGMSIRAPQYWDAQARVLHETPGGGSVDALFVFSDDAFSVVGSDDEGVAIGLTTRFARLRSRWVQPLANGWESELVVSGGPDNQDFAFDGDPEAAYERRIAFGLREELSHDAGEGAWGLRVGADLQGGKDSFLYNVVAFSPYEEDARWFFAPALYAEPSIRLGNVMLTPGVRADALAYDSGYTRATVDPRLGARWVVGGGTLIKAGVGRYSQFPTLRQVSKQADGNPDLREAWSLQSSLGVVQELPLNLNLEVTGFYNRLYDLVVGREDRFKFFTGPPPIGPFDEAGYANEGSGRVCGVELLLKLDAPNTLGLLSATFSNSVRVGRDGEEELFTNDQPFVINALASQKLPKRWRVGVRGRVGAGDPYTPVVNRVYDLGSRSFIPIYGERDSARLPPTWSVDIRIDKEWKFRHWALTAYLDLQNAFNVQNPEVMSWTYDYSAEDPISGLPILPAFGLRGEW